MQKNTLKMNYSTMSVIYSLNNEKLFIYKADDTSPTVYNSFRAKHGVLSSNLHNVLQACLVVGEKESPENSLAIADLSRQFCCLKLAFR